MRSVIDAKNFAICLFCVLTLPSRLLYAVEFWNGEIAGSLDFTTFPTQISKPHGGSEVVSRTAALGPILWIICELEAAGHFKGALRCSPSDSVAYQWKADAITAFLPVGHRSLPRYAVRGWP